MNVDILPIAGKALVVLATMMLGVGMLRISRCQSRFMAAAFVLLLIGIAVLMCQP